MVRYFLWFVTNFYICSLTNGSKYFVYNLRGDYHITWADADKYCRNHSQILPQIYTYEDYKTILKITNNTFWMNDLTFQDGI